MSLVVRVTDGGVRIPLARRRVAEIARAVLRAESVEDAQLSISFVANTRIAALNRRHLGHRGATDVISFAFASPTTDAPIAGDVYIAPGVARRNAIDNGISLQEELTRLVVHGVLHTLGYDHPNDAERMASRMWRRQEQLVHRLLRPSRRRTRRSRDVRSVA